mmetsp:Transcript_12845/g.27054  ORF Transcript_12845/g.27054 Transcript_12845/m.27054 type:complete len:310 (+) Transcript_12845:1977-2906(+)
MHHHRLLKQPLHVRIATRSAHQSHRPVRGIQAIDQNPLGDALVPLSRPGLPPPLLLLGQNPPLSLLPPRLLGLQILVPLPVIIVRHRLTPLVRHFPPLLIHPNRTRFHHLLRAVPAAFENPPSRSGHLPRRRDHLLPKLGLPHLSLVLSHPLRFVVGAHHGGGETDLLFLHGILRSRAFDEGRGGLQLDGVFALAVGRGPGVGRVDEGGFEDGAGDAAVGGEGGGFSTGGYVGGGLGRVGAIEIVGVGSREVGKGRGVLGGFSHGGVVHSRGWCCCCGRLGTIVGVGEAWRWCYDLVDIIICVDSEIIE